MTPTNYDKFGKPSTTLDEWGFPVHKSQFFKSRTEGKAKMVSLKDNANAYESQETKNIVELESVSVEMDMQVATGNEGTKEEFQYNYIEIENEQYRVPKSVLKQLKVHIANNPKLKNFKVIKSGEGMQTEYTVIPL